MSDQIIRVENLGKKYTLGAQRDQGARYRTLRDTLAEGAQQLFRNNGNERNKEEEFWALRNLNFEVKRGEVVGIIGRNGAGKSTLLKILSRITEPTEGKVTTLGRVASLLEVGTGFHPELTGRENIYLNGAILGMTRAEIVAKFDEIVAFAEIAKFLDTPVKRYSSGMYVRLAFAVAAHLEPEILIIDEVLAVGDAEFQKKCLGKMHDVARGGRTVLFVSHNMSAIIRLCQKCIYLDAGQLKFYGGTEQVTGLYLSTGSEMEGSRVWPENSNCLHDSRLVLQAIRIIGQDELISGHVDIRHDFWVEVAYRVTEPLPPFRLSLRFETADGITAFGTADTPEPPAPMESRTPGDYVARCTIPGNLLNEGSYYISIGFDIPFQKVIGLVERAVGIVVEKMGGVSSRFPEKWPGVICPKLEWQSLRLDPSDLPHPSLELTAGS